MAARFRLYVCVCVLLHPSVRAERPVPEAGGEDAYGLIFGTATTTLEGQNS